MMMQGSRKTNGDALTMKIDGCDANRQGLADAKERVGIDGTGGGGVGTPHGGDVEKSVATDAEVEENAEGDDVSDDCVGDDGVGAEVSDGGGVRAEDVLLGGSASDVVSGGGEFVGDVFERERVASETSGARSELALSLIHISEPTRPY